MIKTMWTLGLISLLAVSCAGMSAGLGFSSTATETPVPTATAALTRTTVPTVTATATPDFRIDMQKFVNFPESYDYLLAHLDEFVEAPDPITNRAEFDRWFQEELIPALGPVQQRPLNVNNLQNLEAVFAFRASANLRTMPLIRQPTFFYFENLGVYYPVPCFNTTHQNFPGETITTLCPVLYDGSPVLEDGTSSINKLYRYADLISINVYQDLSARADVDWGIAYSLMESIGGSYYDQENKVVFGIGHILFDNGK